ncbi:Hsp20/alpha crystallin family protein [Thermanaerothrix sp. 4228-RoL]|uniref:Hsp20/alpha crystallin family protein n=1 Tax=Thermanaerothrix solaris TaxID=3058434 RepID=A0ABU3NQQ4_9CHLR|nr:Hsp20/alpha crystallin family protein [Thermanaerothrix sp. 4228-RoL]MDT8898176.1 Hsp20/alpha crystallin family protein [Thermanaerothrix sp. 4228-RoL]
MIEPFVPWREIRRMEREMERMEREMDRLFETFFPRRRRFFEVEFPPMNVWTNPEGAVVTVELPGVNPEQIEVSVVGDTLTLRGKRVAEDLPEGARYQRRERFQGEFARSLQLPFSIDADHVEAQYENGILTITLPRAEADKPKRITVQAA